MPLLGGGGEDDHRDVTGLAAPLDGVLSRVHPEPAHHRLAALVVRRGDRDDVIEAERTERLVQPAGRSLGGITVPPRLTGEPPADLDLVGVPALVMQPT